MTVTDTAAAMGQHAETVLRGWTDNGTQAVFPALMATGAMFVFLIWALKGITPRSLNRNAWVVIFGFLLAFALFGDFFWSLL